MAISYNVGTVLRTNPFDGIPETLRSVTNVVDGDGVLRATETFEFAASTTDEEILQKVTLSLSTKGIPV